MITEALVTSGVAMELMQFSQNIQASAAGGLSVTNP